MAATKLTLKTPGAVVPDGTYCGIWSGYHVAFIVSGRELEAESELGVRGFDITCEVTAKDGELSVAVASK